MARVEIHIRETHVWKIVPIIAAATDSQQVAISVYAETTWASTNINTEKYDADYPFNPITADTHVHFRIRM